MVDKLEKGWFSEINDELWPGQCFSLKVQRVLHAEQSKYQKIAILETANHGRALILDDIIQCTEADEFAYQEMIAMLPLCAHPDPRRVLIVGGGDGGVAREVVKHSSVQHVTQVEIDDRVIAVSRQYLPSMSKGFNSDKLTLVVGDGFEYMRAHRRQFDVIITDSSDPIGPAVNLFTDSYFALLKAALKPGGVVCSQAGTVWVPDGLRHVRETLSNCRRHFRNARYATASVPTYPTGQIGFVVATDDADRNNCDPATPILVNVNGGNDGNDNQNKQYGGALNLHADAVKTLRYYDAEVHRAAFVLPKWVREALDS